MSLSASCRAGLVAALGLMVAVSACGEDAHPLENDVYPLENLARDSARALPQIAAATARAMDYSGDDTMAGASGLGLLGKLFRMECHDGNAEGTNFCPPGIAATDDNAFSDSIVATMAGVEFKLHEIYGRYAPDVEACAISSNGGALGATGEPVYSPAGSDKFVLASLNTLDCYGELDTPDVATSTAYARAEAGEVYATVLIRREEAPAAGQSATSAVQQIYVRKVAETPEIVAFNQVLYQIDANGAGLGSRAVLLVNIAQHRFVIKQGVGANYVVGLGTAGYDADGNYYLGKSALRIIDPGNEIPEALTFCVDNDASLKLADVTTECDEMRDSFLDATSGAWPYVSTFLGLDDGVDQDALLGFAQRFDSGEFLPASEIPTSSTDGFPASIGAE